MSVQILSGVFAPELGGQPLPDGSVPFITDAPDNSVADRSTWSPGATNITPVQPGPPVGQKWSVLAVSVAFNALLLFSGLPLNPYGRLGDVWASLVRAGGTNGTVRPMQAFPTDKTQMTKLYDGANDPPFQSYNVDIGGPLPASYVPHAGGLQLPVPLSINAGEQLAVGIWLTPTLSANVGRIALVNGTYAVAFDDGR